MDLTLQATKSASVTAQNLTPITGASVALALNAASPITLDPADAFAIGDALKDAARKAGYNPNPTP
jgi:hypothetical protein